MGGYWRIQWEGILSHKNGRILGDSMGGDSLFLKNPMVLKHSLKPHKIK